MKALIAIFALLFAAPMVAADPCRMMPEVSGGRVMSWPGLDGGTDGPMTVWIWLPPGYDADASRRLPVLYRRDGQNLFDRKLTTYDQEWRMDEAISRLHRQCDLRRWIVVGAQGPK